MASIVTYYFTHSKCGKVRIIIAPFGFGPRVAAEMMAKQLNLSIGKWQVNSVATKDTKFKVTFNFGVAQPINEPESSFKIWIDCLMWLRNSIPHEVAHYDLFLAENFFMTNPSLIKKITDSKIKDIPPLYSSNGNSFSKHFNKKQNQKGHILVSFGGIETPFTTDIHRFIIPQMVLKSLIDASRKLDDKRKIICCTPLHILKHLQQKLDFPEVVFLSPSHEEFLSILKQSSIYIVQPGLYGPFEAFENNIPTVFTTPFSYTQICQARAYDKNNLAGFIPMWTQLNSEIGELNGNIELEEEICFKKLGIWIRKNIEESNYNYYCEWAEKVLKNDIIPIHMTIQRKQYIKHCKNIKNNYLQNIIL